MTAKPFVPCYLVFQFADFCVCVGKFVEQAIVERVLDFVGFELFFQSAVLVGQGSESFLSGASNAVDHFVKFLDFLIAQGDDAVFEFQHDAPLIFSSRVRPISRLAYWRQSLMKTQQ